MEGGGCSENVVFRLQYGRGSTEMIRPIEYTIGDLKAEIADLHGIPKEMQKVLFKGLLEGDDRTLGELKVKNGSKVMLVGSSPKDLLSVTAQPEDEKLGNLPLGDYAREKPVSHQDKHKKVLEKGPPDGGLPAIKGKQVPLADHEQCIPGLLNALGNKIRLTFKPEVQQLWIGSAQATQKVSYGMISKIESYPIDGMEEYSIMSLQIGPSSSTRYWLYYVPSQLVAAIKLRILGVMSLM